MAKIAVIFVLFALCSVAMSARITREEPNPIQTLIDSLKNFADSTNAYFQKPETQAKLKNIQDEAANLTKKGGEQFTQAAAEIQNNLQELAKNSEGTIKDLVESAKKNFEDSTKAKKN